MLGRFLHEEMEVTPKRDWRFYKAKYKAKYSNPFCATI